MAGETLRAPARLQVPAALLLTGQLLYIAVTQLHAGGDANDHHAIFATYAHNTIWMDVHLGQFLAIAILSAGLVGLFSIFDPQATGGRWVARLGMIAAAVAVSLYGALQAVDGVALKQATSAWMAAPEVEKAARFAAAEVVRWLEWGMRSYQDYALGLTLLLVAAVAWSPRWMPRLIPVLVGLSGLAYLVQGWVAGSEGFSGTQSLAIVAGWALCLVWMIWLAVIAWRAGNADAL